MTNAEYWKQRTKKQIDANELNATKTLKKMEKVYLEVEEQIRKETMAIFGRFGLDKGLKPNQVASYLTASEYKVWRKSVEGYMKEIEALGAETPEGRALWLELEVLSAKSRVNRLEALRTAVMANMAKLASVEAAEVQGHLVETFTDDYYDNMYTLYRSNAPEVIKRMEENAIALQSSDVLNIVTQPWSGADFSTRIWKNEYLTADKMTSIVAQTLLAGKSPQRIAQAIHKEVGVSKSNAMRLILTETAHVKTEADIKACEDTDVEKVKFVATLDGHTCHEGCGRLDGKIFKMTELKPGVNQPPLHPRCRCILMPYNEWLEEAHNKYGSRIARDENGRNVTEKPDMSYEEWKKKYASKPEKPKAPTEPKKPKEPKKAKADVLAKPLTTSSDEPYKGLLEGAKSLSKVYNPAKRLKALDDTDSATRALAGGDETRGSCASLAMAYVGRRNGLDVLDFKGGECRRFFSMRINQYTFSNVKGAKTLRAEGGSSTTVGNRLLKQCEVGKEYYLCTGRHASIVRNLGEIEYRDAKGRKKKRNRYQYLELQSPINSGWCDFDEHPRKTLEKRFGCNAKQSGTFDFMIDLNDSDFNNDEFRSLMGYINTKPDEQKKGGRGTVK